MSIKRCQKCKQEKPVTEFHKHKGNEDGIQNWCKECRCNYAQTELGRASDKVRSSRYYKSEKGQKTAKVYRESHKDVFYRGNKKYRHNNPNKYKAHSVVSYAVSSGRLVHPSTLNCIVCDTQAQEYHHDDYLKPLDVTPICRNCHVGLHKEGQSYAKST